LELEERAEIPIVVDGRTISAREGETVAAALTANGIRVFRHTAKRREPRGLFCGIGQCTDCVMEIDGVPNQRTCMTIVRAGMVVNTQQGHGASGRQTMKPYDVIVVGAGPAGLAPPSRRNGAARASCCWTKTAVPAAAFQADP
jgi:NADPH-dependent 2,4-dienoyl-CoA reductase/sulfur reductase-like enzyme